MAGEESDSDFGADSSCWDTGAPSAGGGVTPSGVTSVADSSAGSVDAAGSIGSVGFSSPAGAASFSAGSFSAGSAASSRDKGR